MGNCRWQASKINITVQFFGLFSKRCIFEFESPIIFCALIVILGYANRYSIFPGIVKKGSFYLIFFKSCILKAFFIFAFKYSIGHFTEKMDKFVILKF